MAWYDKPSTKTKYIQAYPGSAVDMQNLAKAALPGAESRVQTAGQPIPTQTAQLTGTQQKAMMNLDEYLQNGFPSDNPLYQAGAQGLESILGEANTEGGALGPVADTYYQAFRTAALRELQESKDRLASTTSAREKYFGGGRIQTEGELEEDFLTQLLMAQTQLRQQALDRATTAAPIAMESALTQARYPAEQAATGLQLGEVERGIEDIGYQREYAEQVRQLTDAGLPLETAIALMTYNPTVTAQQTQGEFWSLLQALGPAAGAYAGAGGANPFLI